MDTRGKVGIGLKKNSDGAIVVAGLSKSGPAETAGLLVGDVLETIDGRSVPLSVDAAGTMLNGAVDSVVAVKVKRSGVFSASTVSFKITRKDMDPKPPAQRRAAPPHMSTVVDNGGFSLSAIFDQGLNQSLAAVGAGVGIGVELKTQGGAVVIKSIGKGGGADKAGGRIQVNDAIVEIDGVPVEQKVETVQAKLLGARGSEVKLRVRRTGVFGFQVCLTPAPALPPGRRRAARAHLRVSLLPCIFELESQTDTRCLVPTCFSETLSDWMLDSRSFLAPPPPFFVLLLPFAVSSSSPLACFLALPTLPRLSTWLAHGSLPKRLQERIR